MTLPGSGTISMSQVNTELSKSSSANTSLGASDVRTLAAVPSGAIDMSDLHGKSATYVPSSPATHLYIAATNNSGTAGITQAWYPGHVAGDVLILAIQTANESVSTPSGCTAINTPTGTGTAAAAQSTRMSAFWIRATSSSMSNISIADAGDHVQCATILIRGLAPTGNPVSSVTSNIVSTASATITYAAVTTSYNNSCVLYLSGLGQNSVAGSLTDNANLTTDASGGTDTGAVYGAVQGVGSGVAFYIGRDATAGSVASYTGQTVSTTRKQENLSIAFIPGESNRTQNIQYTGGSGNHAFLGNARVDLQFLTYGIVTLTGDPLQTWATNPQTAGGSYEIQVTQSASNGVGSFTGTLNTWLALSTSRLWTLQYGGMNGVSATRTLLVSIRNAGGSTIVSNATVTMEAYSEDDGGVGGVGGIFL